MSFSTRFTLSLGLAAAGGAGIWSNLTGDDCGRGMIDEPPRRPMAVRCVEPVAAEGVAVPRRPKPLAGSLVSVDFEAVDFGARSAEAGWLQATAAIERFEPTREELELRAMMVERQANKQLRSLIGVLDLTDAQQDRIFAVLARRSNYYHPALEFRGPTGAPLAGVVDRPGETPVTQAPATPGLPGGQRPDSVVDVPDAVEDPIVAELEPEQVEVYERHLSERESFWAGVINDIEHKLGTNGR